MTLFQIYIVVSAFSLLFVAVLWSSHGWKNILVKLTFTGLAFFGLIMTAKALPMLGI